MTAKFDVAVVGGGLTGLTAAHHAALEGCSVVHYIGSGLPGGLAANVGELDGFPATGPVSVLDLALRLTEENQGLGVEVMPEDVTRLDVTGGGMQLHAGSGAMMAGAVIAASGARLRMLDVPGAARLFDKGVSQCAWCNGTLYKAKQVVVAGGGDSALQEALHLAKYAALVTVVARGAALKARRSLVDRAAWKPTWRKSSAARSFRGCACETAQPVRSTTCPAPASSSTSDSNPTRSGWAAWPRSIRGGLSSRMPRRWRPRRRACMPPAPFVAVMAAGSRIPLARPRQLPSQPRATPGRDGWRGVGKSSKLLVHHTNRLCSTAAPMKLANSGWGSKGRLLSSG
jgi:hypothetical protein